MPRQRGVRPPSCDRSCVHWLTSGSDTTVTPARRTASSVSASSSGGWKARELRGVGSGVGVGGGPGLGWEHASALGRPGQQRRAPCWLLAGPQA